MTDSTPVRRYIAMVHTLTDGDGLIPLADAEPVGVVLASDFDRLQAENVRLKGEVDSTNRALMNSGRLLGKNLAEIMILTEERDSLRAQIAARDERIRGLEEAVEGLLAAFPVGLRNEVQSLMIGHAIAALAKGEANE